jgi:hypothetical protein
MPKSKESPFDRFVKADQPLKNRLFGASYGEPGSGKTHFWLGAPGPIVLFSMDKGQEGVVEKFQDEKDIYIKEYEWEPTPNPREDSDIDEANQEAATLVRDAFVEDFQHAITIARTVIIDKETDIWELFRYAEFGKPKDAPLNYAPLNQGYRQLINMPKALDINFGLIQAMKEPWMPKVNKKSGAIGAGPSGDLKRHGFKEIEGLVHINIFHSWKAGDDGPEFMMDIGKTRGPATKTIQGTHQENLSFVELAQLVFPDSTEEDWQ